MRSRPTRKQIIAGATAITLLLASIVAKEIVVAQHGPPSAIPSAHAVSSPVQQVIDLDAHHFRGIRAHQQLWDPRNDEDVLTIAQLGKRYHKEISQVDLTSCPKSFKTAYAAHTHEWNEIIEALTVAVSTAPDRDALASDVRRITKPLEATWTKVQATARDAGVFVRN